MSAARYKSLKELRFRKPDGEVVSLEIPGDVNQDLLRHAVLDDYLVMTVATGRPIAESEVCTLKSGNSIVGFLIPGQTVLSPDQQLNSDPIYGTYSLIAAMKVCDGSFKQKYDLSPHSLAGFDSVNTVFYDDIFYLVVWLTRLGVSAADFTDDYFVSLARHGINPSSGGRRPLQTQRTLKSYGQSIQLSRNAKWPGYVRTIISELEPYAADPFLRFFYLYQVIETLMSVNFKSELAQIRIAFSAQPDISITQLREYVEKFQRIYKEKSRINNALRSVCPRSYASAEALLAELGEFDTDDTFGEMIYKVRNIVFHDYQRVHPFSNLVADLEEDLVSYILDKQLA
jgi:hypothetical protein